MEPRVPNTGRWSVFEGGFKGYPAGLVINWRTNFCLLWATWTLTKSEILFQWNALLVHLTR